MKLPKVIKTYCPNCQKQGEHEVELNKKGRASSLSKGTRRYNRVKKGYKGSPRTPKKPVYKIGKRPFLILTCKSCGKKQQRVYRARTKKPVEIS